MLTPAPKLLASLARSICSATTSCHRVSENVHNRHLSFRERLFSAAQFPRRLLLNTGRTWLQGCRRNQGLEVGYLQVRLGASWRCRTEPLLFCAPMHPYSGDT